MDGLAPAALVEAVALDAAGGEGGEQAVVAIDVVGEAMNEEEDCCWGSFWLRGRSVEERTERNRVVAGIEGGGWRAEGRRAFQVFV